MHHKLEMADHDFRTLSADVLNRLSDFIAGLPSLPVTTPVGTNAFDWLEEPLPRVGSPATKAISSIFEKIATGGHQFHSPGYQCYIPTGGLIEASLADWIASTLNRFSGYREWAPGINQLEKTGIAWLAEILGLPSTFSGILTSGGSLANFTALYTARFHHVSEEDLPRATLYCSSQAHHSILRAGQMLGLRRAHIRLVDVGADYRIDLVKLEETLKEDSDAGLFPFLLIGMGGTTGSGAVDNLQALHAIAKRWNLWFHVDAAWAGGFRLLESTRSLFDGIENADSVTFDPHKALFLPMGCGALLIRKWHLLEAAHSVEITYLPDDQNALEYNPSKAGLELLRPSRGLQLWLPLKMHGIEPFIEAHQEKWELTQHAYQALRSLPNIEFLHSPQVAIVVFRHQGRPECDAEERDKLNKALVERINDTETKLSGAQFKDGYWLRIAPFGLRTHRLHVDQAIEKIRSAFAAVHST
jgi:aromatic-L-amino-acid/L-tryptophan decarboxylase